MCKDAKHLKKKRASESRAPIVLFNNCYAMLPEVPDHPGSIVIQKSYLY